MVREYEDEEISEPITVQMRLPVAVLERLDSEAKRDMIPRTLLVRRCVLDHYGRGNPVSAERTNRTSDVQNIRPTEANGNA